MKSVETQRDSCDVTQRGVSTIARVIGVGVCACVSVCCVYTEPGAVVIT